MSVVAAASWSSACVDKIKILNSTSTSGINGLVDRAGHLMSPTSFLTNSTFGITYQLCLEQCGSDKIYQAFIFNNFAAAFASWLLPWLALSAQLPYEASGPFGNIMSCLLAIGSPALITYSLSLTVLNRYWVLKRFAEVKTKQVWLGKRIDTAKALLLAAQQAPIRVSQEEDRLQSLLVWQRNDRFWTTLETNLENTRRGFSASLLAQMLVAATAYLLTVIGAFNGHFDPADITLQVASGSIWVWMIPVILGWIIVGTQSRSRAVHLALKHTHEAYTNDTTEGSEQKVFSEAKDVSPWGFSVTGDEGEEGPIYNYSRVFTWSRCANVVIRGVSKTQKAEINSQGQGPSVIGVPPGDPMAAPVVQGSYPAVHKTGVASSQQSTQASLTYPSWHDVPSDVWWRIGYASMAALFVQWGTTGPAVVMAYLTPTVGLSCRSGGTLLYGVAATVVWCLLVTSSFLSHRVMLEYQKIPPLEVGQVVNSTESSPNERSGAYLWACVTSALREGNNRPAYDDVELGPLRNSDATRPMNATGEPAILVQESTEPVERSRELGPDTNMGGREATSVIGTNTRATGTTVGCVTPASQPNDSAAAHTRGIEPSNRKIPRRRDTEEEKKEHDAKQLILLKNHPVTCALVVCTRFAGKGLAVLNAALIITSGLLEYIGTYHHCMCAANALLKKKGGWAAIFMGAEGFEPIVRVPSYSVGGMAFAIIVCAVSLMFFTLASQGPD